MSESGVTTASLVPSQLRRLLEAGAEPGPDLRRILLGGGPMPRALLSRARAAGFPVCPSYGLTQACSTVTVAEPGDLETAGRALPGVGVAITDHGEIIVSGATVNTLGSLRTGDLGHLDEQGRLIVTGRKGDMIVTGGENVSPAEVEAVLAEHPDVVEAAVFARPHPLWGEAITALVVARPGAELAAGGAARALPGAAGALQGAEGVRARRRAAAHRVGQGPPRRAALAWPEGMALPDDFRAQSRKRWGDQAEGWESRRDEMRTSTMPVSAWLIDAIDPQPGDTLLELAAGTGDTGLLAAELIEPGGTLISSDFSPEMLQTAQRRAEELGVHNVRFKQIDAETSIDVETASVDGVLCRWGYMLMADPETALRETRRVLRPGRRVALAAWAGPGGEPLERAAGARDGRPGGLRNRPTRPSPASSRGREEGLIAQHLDAAGFTEHRVEPLDFPIAYRSAADWWAAALALSSGFRAAVQQASDDDLAAVGDALDRHAERFAHPGRHAADPRAHVGRVGGGVSQQAAAKRSSSSGQPCGELIAAS